MIEIYEKKLHKSVCDFKKRAQKIKPDWSEENDNGEWEIGMCEFDEMYNNILVFIGNFSRVNPSQITGQIIDDILFGIARDNECGRIVNILVERYPEWYSFLCKKSLKTAYTNAKWQFAETLKDYKGSDEKLRELIFEFLETGDEYTERMALQSLAFLYPEKAEKYAVDFWERNKYENDEYQKIMALHVLYIINSPKLEFYLGLAGKSKYKWLKQNAKEIREKISG